MVISKSFVHGNAFMTERGGGSSVSSPGPLDNVQDGGIVNWSDVIGYAQGWGKTYRGKENQRVWFHVAISTPSMMSGSRIQLDKIYIFSNTTQGCFITDVDVWDGKYPVGTFRDLAITGDHSEGEFENQTVFRPRISNDQLHTMIFGLGISVRVTFTTRSNVTFHSAGADFLVSN